MRRLRAGVVLLLVALLASCGDSHARRHAVNAYFDQIDRAQQDLLASTGQIDSAFQRFRLTGNTPAEIRQLELAQTQIATTLRRVRAISAPRDAANVHADLVAMLSLESAVAHELVSMTRFVPQLAQTLTPLHADGTTLARQIAVAGKARPRQVLTPEETAGAAVWKQAGCGGCHTLAAAHSTGAVGPNLDQLRPSAAAVAAQVRSGGGGMPSFRKRLSPAEISALATFVAGADNTAARTTAVLNAYGAAFAAYGAALAAVIAKLDLLHAPPTLRPTLRDEQRTLRRGSALSRSIAAALRKNDLTAANAGVRRLFATTSSATAAASRRSAAAAVARYQARLAKISALAVRIARERQQLVQQLG